MGARRRPRGGAAANAVSAPPGEYGRKPETQRNWRGPAQPVERLVQFDANRKTLPGLDMVGNPCESEGCRPLDGIPNPSISMLTKQVAGSVMNPCQLGN
jgi:hypothetical protein